MLPMWIVTANAGRARLFEAGNDGVLLEVEDRVNPAVRLRVTDKESDRLGPTSAGKSVHNTGGAAPNKAYEPHQTPDEHETELFAKDVAAYLLQAYQQQRFAKLGLIASPQFLGVLRKVLDKQVQPALVFDINKDLTQLAVHDLQTQLPALMEQASKPPSP